MKVSIVTISFNQAKFVEQTILSVLDQDYENIEYIVVDPGSTDGSREIIERYKDQISHIVFEEDEGPADGLNKGFSYATGDVFGYVNADDLLLPGAIAQIVNSFEQYPQIDCISGNGTVIDSHGNVIRKIYSDKYSLLLAAYGASILIQPSSFIKSRAFMQVGGFNTNNRSNWDDELFVDLKINGASFKRINGFLSAYRLHSESITGAMTIDLRIKNYQKIRFSKIMHRDPRSYDFILRAFFQNLRHLVNYRDTFQRIKNGPLYGRCTKG